MHFSRRLIRHCLRPPTGDPAGPFAFFCERLHISVLLPRWCWSAIPPITPWKTEPSCRESIDHLSELRGLVQPVQKHLAPEYSDKDGRLLADPPSNRKDLLDPDTLVLAHYIDADVDKQLVDWEALQADLAQATGKTVLLQEYLNTADDVAAVKAGAIQIVALHAADAPYVVNNAGFDSDRRPRYGGRRDWQPSRHRRPRQQQNPSTRGYSWA